MNDMNALVIQERLRQLLSQTPHIGLAVWSWRCLLRARYNLLVRTTNLERLAWMRELVATPGAARAIREAAGLSQAEQAAALNVTQTAVSRWERGERVPRGQAAQDYARLLERLARRAS